MLASVQITHGRKGVQGSKPILMRSTAFYAYGVITSHLKHLNAVGAKFKENKDMAKTIIEWNKVRKSNARQRWERQ